MKSYLLSQLRTRFPEGAEPELRRTHPHDWLLWEPGSWRPDAGGTAVVQPAQLEAARAGGPTHAKDEALALALAPDGKTELSLGRGPKCDLVLNDGTLSTVHLLFKRSPTNAWSVMDVGSKNGSWCDGVKLVRGFSVNLRDGFRLQAGQVIMTYYAPGGMFGRLRAKPG